LFFAYCGLKSGALSPIDQESGVLTEPVGPVQQSHPAVRLIHKADMRMRQRRDDAANFGQTAQAANQRIPGMGTCADVGQDFVAVIGAPWQGVVGAACVTAARLLCQ
jgi:hypothetical protein